MFLTGLDRVLNDAAVSWTARSGWRTRTLNRAGYLGVRAVMWHTTESARAVFDGRDAPTLGYVESGLGYPLYNILIGRSGHAYLIAAGTAAHAGKGGGHGLPTDAGNRYAVGVSFDANNHSHPVTAAQLETGARIGAAFDREWEGSLRHVMHGEYAPGRRSDPTKIPGGWAALRAAIARGYWNTPTTTPSTGRTWFDMATKDELAQVVRDNVGATVITLSNSQQAALATGRSTWRLDNLIGILAHRIGYNFQRSAIIRDNVAAAAGERAGLLEAIRQVAGGAEVDLGAIEKAAERGVADALASLEADVTLTINTDQDED